MNRELFQSFHGVLYNLLICNFPAKWAAKKSMNQKNVQTERKGKGNPNRSRKHSYTARM